jgi:catechol 2,3-dioxygenase-like lactoylglutathione lyase family enzyme
VSATQPPSIGLRNTVLGARDIEELTAFYEQLLGWQRRSDEEDWKSLRNPNGGPGLAFQPEPEQVPPTWPAAPDDQHMQLHLDFEVQDLDGAAAHATSAGAVLADFQPQDDVRVFLDPAGHPFCLFVELPPDR